MSDQQLTCAPACRAGVWGRLSRGAVALIVGAFGASMLSTDPVIAVAAGVMAAIIAVMAVTGTCPTDWLTTRRQSHTPQHPLDIPDARQHVDLTSAPVPNRSSHVHE